MPFTYLGDIATADVAFKAWGKTPAELFIASADAVMQVMVDNLDAIAVKEHRTVALTDESLELLLFHFLQELIYYKDAETLLLRALKVEIAGEGTLLTLAADLGGEQIIPGKHHLQADVKAVTFHRFEVKQVNTEWHSFVVLDI